jgi:hypothetical protein
MVKSRASVFSDSPEIDLSDFAVKPPAELKAPSPEQVRAVSEAANFRSREASPPPPTAPRKSRTPRRYRTGRNVQINIKTSQEAVDDFYAITDAHKGWVLGYTFERAITALKRELEKKRQLETQS